MTGSHDYRIRAAALLLGTALALSACQSGGPSAPPDPAKDQAAAATPGKPAPDSVLSVPRPQTLAGPWSGADLKSDGTCRDTWVTTAVREVNGASNTPTGRACDTKLYGGGSWSSYPDLVGKVRTTMGTCSDRWVTQAVLEVAGRLPSSSECTVTRYGGGSWSSFADLKTKVTAALSTPVTPPAPPRPPAPPVQPPAPPLPPALPPAPPVQPPAPPVAPPVVSAPPVITSAVYGGNLGPGRLKTWINGTGLERATAVVYGVGRTEVTVPITAQDRSMRQGAMEIEAISPIGADLSSIAVSSPQGRSNVVGVRNVPGVPSLTSVQYDGNLGPGIPKIFITGTNLDLATEVLYGQGSKRVSQNVKPEDRKTSSGKPALQMVPPQGADLTYVVVATQGGFSNVMSVTGMPGVVSITAIQYDGNLGPGIPKIFITGTNLDLATEVLYGQGSRRVSQNVKPEDRKTSSGKPALQMVPPQGADLTYVVVATQGGYSNAMGVAGMPTVPVVTSVTYLSRHAAGGLNLRIEGSNLVQATEVLYGRVPEKILSVPVAAAHKVGGALLVTSPMGANLNAIVVVSQGGYSQPVALLNPPPPPCAVTSASVQQALQSVTGRAATAAETQTWLAKACGTPALPDQAAAEAAVVRSLSTSSEGAVMAHDMVERAFQAVYGGSSTRKLQEVFYGRTRRDEWRSNITVTPRKYSTLVEDVRTWKATTSPTRTKYVALGDSFSSGEGAPLFYADTWEVRDSKKTLLNNCHRSQNAYSVKLFEDAKNANPDLRQFDFQACSGAVLENINGGIKQYPGLAFQQQLDAVDTSAAMITVGIGGNDMGFATVLAYCVFHSDCDDWFKGQANGRKVDMNDNNTAVMYHRLVHFYGQLREKSGDAPIYAVSYPNLFSLEKDLSFPMWGQGSGFDKGEVAYIQSKLTTFNQTIAKAAQAAGINYVDVNTRWGKGHEYQMPESWINEFKFWGQVTWGDGDGKYAFHPTVLGQHADYLALKDAQAHLPARNPSAGTPAGVPALPNHWWTLDKLDTKGTGLCGLNPACKPLDVNEGELLIDYKNRGGKLGSSTIGDDHHKLTLHAAPVRLVGKEPVVYYFDGLSRNTQVDQEVAKHNWCSGGIGNWRGWNSLGWPWTEGDRQYLMCGK